MEYYPFPHIIKYNLIEPSLLHNVKVEYDELLEKMTCGDSSGWKHYDNPLEKKHSFNILADTVYISAMIATLGTPAFVQSLRETFQIEDELELDRDLYGAGLHNHPTGGYLCTHLDYEINPVTYKKRWLNLILYLNDDWKEEYNGDTELWNSDRTLCQGRVYPECNKALIFQTTDSSWHGLSRPIRCPPNTSRKTIALYYTSKRTYEKEVCETTRLKAFFYHPEYEDLCNIRNTRLITTEDLPLPPYSIFSITSDLYSLYTNKSGMNDW
jgi:hypothetical protein